MEPAFRSPVQAGSGMGLRTMQYRAGMIGATLLVQAAGRGRDQNPLLFPEYPHPPAR